MNWAVSVVWTDVKNQATTAHDPRHTTHDHKKSTHRYGIFHLRLRFEGAADESDLTGYTICPYRLTGVVDLGNDPITHRELCRFVEKRGQLLEPPIHRLGSGSSDWVYPVEYSYNTTTDVMRVRLRGGEYRDNMHTEIVLKGPGRLTWTHIDLEDGYTSIWGVRYVGREN